MSNERRRDYMVSRKVHLLYMATWVSSILLIAALAWMTVTLSGLKERLARVGEDVQGEFVIVGVLAFAVILFSLVLAVYTIVHTHRLLGSAYRIGVTLKELNAGDPKARVKLRDGDFFLEIADEINRLAERQPGAAGGPSEPAKQSPPAGEAPTISA